jgi:hypothetical protein
LEKAFASDVETLKVIEAYGTRKSETRKPTKSFDGMDRPNAWDLRLNTDKSYSNWFGRLRP